ncbi:unnamed protein product [Boreogadus saida]
MSRIHHLDLVLYVRLDCSHRHHLLHSQLHHLILDPYSGPSGTSGRTFLTNNTISLISNSITSSWTLHSGCHIPSS